MERIKNEAQTTLNGAIDDSQVTFDVHNAGNLPPVNCRVKIDDELMLVTNIATDTLTVSRGIEGTTAASHVDNSDVVHVLTAGAFDAIQADNVSIGDSLVDRVRGGRIIMPHFLSTVTEWKGIGPLFRYYTPPSSGWSWIDQSTATSESHVLGEKIHWTGTAANFRCRVRNLGVSSNFTVTAGLFSNIVLYNNIRAGIMLFESSTGKALLLGRLNQNLRVDRYTWSSSWSFNNNDAVFQPLCGTVNGIFWCRFVHDGTDITAYVSSDKRNWIPVATVAATTAFTTNPDQFLFFTGKTTSPPNNISVQLVSYEVS